MIINTYKDKILPLNPEEGLFESVCRYEEEDEDEDEDRFYTPKEATPRSEIPDFRIREMFEDEEEIPKDMPDLESEQSAEQRRKQKGQGLKILTPQQMLSRLPISLAQLKVRNNSEKLKNEIRQLLYSLYRSKKLSKTICKHLMNAI